MAKTETGTHPETGHEKTATVLPSSSNSAPETNVLSNRMATVAAVGLGVALIEAELIPGMLIGVAAMLAPNLLPRIGNAMRPLLKGAVKAGYSVVERAKETVGDASEQMQDIVAEVKSERQADESPIGSSRAASETPKSKR